MRTRSSGPTSTAPNGWWPCAGRIEGHGVGTTQVSEYLVAGHHPNRHPPDERLRWAEVPRKGGKLQGRTLAVSVHLPAALSSWVISGKRWCERESRLWARSGFHWFAKLGYCTAVLKFQLLGGWKAMNELAGKLSFRRGRAAHCWRKNPPYRRRVRSAAKNWQRFFGATGGKIKPAAACASH